MEFSGTRLRLELDRVPLWRGDHVPLKQLAEDFAQYLYLPRLKDSSVLTDAAEDGLALLTWKSEAFAYADGWDESRGRYRGLRAGQKVAVAIDRDSLLVKPEVAAKQLEAEAAPPTTAPTGGTATATYGGDVVATGPTAAAPPIEPRKSVPIRFHGSVQLDPMRIGRDAGKIAEEVVQHLVGLSSSKVEVTLEINAEAPGGVPDNVVRTVTENCRTLKFKTHGFEEK